VRALKRDSRVVERNGLCYAVDSRGKRVTYKPWLGDAFSFLYDRIMEKSVFPKKFGADIETHYEILASALQGTRGDDVLELATGSGSAVHFVQSDNSYVGTDISPGLLKIARRRFADAGFREPEFYVVAADALPFADSSFDLVLCVLSLNFFSDAEAVFREVRRVTRAGGAFVCSVPVPERKHGGSVIHGSLRTAEELRALCEHHDLQYESLSQENGGLLYFRAAAR